jgi:hypothetical protein
MAEIRQYLRALRQRANDFSITAAMGNMIYLNSNMGEGGQRVTDLSIFLPHRAEYIESQQKLDQARLRMSRTTASVFMAHQHLFSAKVNGVIGSIVEDVERVLSGA